MFKKLDLFGGRIDPACQYCEYGRMTKDLQMVVCKKNGAVAPYFSCKNFQYSPLKRIPRRTAPLPRYSKEDFKL